MELDVRRPGQPDHKGGNQGNKKRNENGAKRDKNARTQTFFRQLVFPEVKVPTDLTGRHKKKKKGWERNQKKKRTEYIQGKTQE